MTSAHDRQHTKSIEALAYEGPSTHICAQGPVLGYTRASVGAANQLVTLTYNQGVAPNTDYIVFLLARDDHSNVQDDFTVVFVHTDDNIPPNWVQHSVTGKCAYTKQSLYTAGGEHTDMHASGVA